MINRLLRAVADQTHSLLAISLAGAALGFGAAMGTFLWLAFYHAFLRP